MDSSRSAVRILIQSLCLCMINGDRLKLRRMMVWKCVYCIYYYYYYYYYYYKCGNYL